MSRIQAVAKVYRTNVKQIGGTNLIEIHCAESCWSKSRKKAQEKLKLEDEQNGQYTMFWRLKIWGGEKVVARFDRLEKGDFIDFCGTVEEDIWADKDGNHRKALCIANADVQFMPGVKSRKKEAEKPKDENFGASTDEDDIPF